MTWLDLKSMLPLLILLVWAMILLLLDLWIRRYRIVTAVLAALGLAVSLGFTLYQPETGNVMNGMFTVDAFSKYLSVFFYAAGILGVTLAHDYLARMQVERGDYYVLLLFSVSGMVMMAHANDLVIFFLSLELLSIPLYVLAGYAYTRIFSEEAALKYFLLGTFASAFVLFGIAMVFGAAAGTNLDAVALAMYAHGFDKALFLAGVGFIVVGFAFKMAAAPFHFWSPDVYQGAPTCVTGFMAVGVKAAAVAGLLRLISVLFQGITDQLTPVVWGLAALTMVVGNLAALSQTNIKRLLAYSSIAHAGYLLVALSPFGQGALAGDMFTSVLFYLVVYGLNSFGAWAVVIALEYAVGEWKEPKGLTLEEYAGLGQTHPWLAVAMLVFMLSFTGMPLTLGFWGKFYLFRTAMEGGFVWLALIGLVASLASAYYYLRVVVYMFMKPGEPVVTGEEPWALVVAYAAAALVVVLSFVPGPLLALAAGALPGL